MAAGGRARRANVRILPRLTCAMKKARRQPPAADAPAHARRCDILPRFGARPAFRKDDPDQIALQSQPPSALGAGFAGRPTAAGGATFAAIVFEMAARYGKSHG
ncbi:hypothetical protein WS68_10095 [Burkholderia sp. TSV86]|nr:hypothetical protein WS68_10095 [Burkholderia sp. TSV86]